MTKKNDFDLGALGKKINSSNMTQLLSVDLA